MSIGRRIKDRRKTIGMSADRLGELLGKDRSTIYRYEKGDIENLPLDILQPIAQALNTTPQYLMGWREDDKKNTPSAEPKLTEGEKNLLENYRKLSDEAKEVFNDAISSYGSFPEEKRQLALQMLRFALGNQ